MSVIVSNPNNPSQNVIQATADVPDLTLRPFSDTQTSRIFRVQNQAGTLDTFSIGPNGTAADIVRIQNDPVNIGRAIRINNVNPLGIDIFVVTDVPSGTPIFSVEGPNSGVICAIVGVVPTDAVVDIRGAASQSAPILQVRDEFGAAVLQVGPQTFGVFGSGPVTQRAGASAAGIAAIVDPNAKAAVAALQAALASYGLVTSPA